MSDLLANTKILTLLQKQRDDLYDELISNSISDQHKEMYEDVKSGRVFSFDDDERQMLSDLSELKEDKSFDASYLERVNLVKQMDNQGLTRYFESEFIRIFNLISASGDAEEIQAIFIGYDFYYHYSSGLECLGSQVYPLVEEPRYITGEYDHTKRVLFIDEGINFEPAWPACNDFEDLEYLDINIEKLFQLHSRVLLHHALANLDEQNKLSFTSNRPLAFYIFEHDCEVMTLYWKN